ncbi:protoheme IX farnesyltransferase, mitochondrial [Chelonus insularis]|uniref:protoheme IX farnesyltransferase, mitochondrial n=1 Tax=Chelonus insularis TaxID=460826 RepID=UPI00158A2FA3|nr:protoheme IX farnesyltransferase, mitochondrial [Chelonus insularis]XP_034951333.1 protoheme IX farnesyltransferase, mitochondrial [Chelonus insularis]
MIFILTPLRLCKYKSYSLQKFIAVTYSTKVAPKELPKLKEKPWITSPNSKSHLRIKPAALSPPEAVLSNINFSEIPLETTKRKKEEWKDIKLDYSKLHKYCLMLSKIRLTSLVVITTMGGYVIAPGVFDPYTFIMCSVGTGLVSATANSVNQFFEVPFDAQMSRTKNRVLVRGYLTPGHAILFAAASGIAGLSLLNFQVNGLTAALGATNLILYTLIYTPMKRVSILNTWVGSIVGAIPPLMGWAACTGDILAPGAWIMSGILYAWQFPHFNALSWNLRPDYSRAGYRMMAVTNPDLCRKTALRYTAVLTGLSYLAPILDVTNWSFAILSTPLNTYFLYLAWRFYKESDSANSRKLFRFSLIHLPLLMIMMLCSKKHWSTKKDTLEQLNHKDIEKGGSRFDSLYQIFATPHA